MITLDEMLLAFHLKGSLIIKAEMHVFEFECQVTQVSPTRRGIIHVPKQQQTLQAIYNLEE